MGIKEIIISGIVVLWIPLWLIKHLLSDILKELKKHKDV